MKKKIIIISVLWGLVNLMLSCCPDAMTIYYSINELNIGNCALDKPSPDHSIIARGAHRILVDLKANSFVKNNAKFSTISSAYATSCEDNHVGLKADITEFSISCNQKILGVEAGQPISFDKMDIYKIGFNEDSKNQRQTIDEWIRILNVGGYLLAFQWYIEFKEPIVSNEYLNFKIKIRQEDGSTFVAETNAIRLQ